MEEKKKAMTRRKGDRTYDEFGEGTSVGRRNVEAKKKENPYESLRGAPVS